MKHAKHLWKESTFTDDNGSVPLAPCKYGLINAAECSDAMVWETKQLLNKPEDIDAVVD